MVAGIEPMTSQTRRKHYTTTSVKAVVQGNQQPIYFALITYHGPSQRGFAAFSDFVIRNFFHLQLYLASF